MIKNPADIITAVTSLIHYAPKLLTRLGMPTTDHELVQRIVGSGEHAVVFSISSDKVLKITDDPDDAAAAEAVRHHGRTRGLVEIYETYRVPREGERDLYVIVAERVLTTRDVGKKIETAAYLGKLLVDNGMYIYDAYVKEWAKKKGLDVPSTELVRKFANDLVEARKTAYQLGFSIDQDLHLGNIGYRRDEHGQLEAVVIDYGYQSWIRGDKPQLQLVANSSDVDIAVRELLAAPGLLKRYGLPQDYSGLIDRRIGGGSYATVFGIDDEMVIKVTKDPDDASLSMKVSEAGTLRGIVRVYEVYEGPIKSFFIVAERLKVLPFPKAHGWESIHSADPLIETLQLAMDADWGWNDEEWEQYAGSQYHLAIVQLAKQFKEDINEGLKNLRELGGSVKDIHSWNVGIREGADRPELVILDFGHQSWKGKKRPELPLAKNTARSKRIVERLGDYQDPSFCAGSEGIDIVLSRDPYQIAELFDLNTVTQADADAAAAQVVEMSQQELKRRGLTGPITVYRGGLVPASALVVPVSLDKKTAEGHATKWGYRSGEKAKFWTATILPEHVAAVVDLFTGGAYDEKELLVWRKAFDELAKNPDWTKIKNAFNKWFDHVQRTFPDFGKLELHSDAKAHDGDRHFAYCKHDNSKISVMFAPEAEDLPESNILGLMAHEFGHAIDFRYSKAKLEKRLGALPRDVEERADAIANEVFGITIRYDKHLVQCVSCQGTAPRPKGLR